ncbi:MAG: Asp-tRNA(Asn)/Glu-tRNA(Gln) amidotransferase subunit GatC [Candidatus Woesearchaeota archaeon]
MEITKEKLAEVARVARLELTEEELERFVPQMQEVLAYFDILQKAPTKGVVPSFQPIRVRNVMREDVPKKSISPEEALANSSQNQESYFKGPRAV